MRCRAGRQTDGLLGVAGGVQRQRGAYEAEDWQGIYIRTGHQFSKTRLTQSVDSPRKGNLGRNCPQTRADTGPGGDVFASLRALGNAGCDWGDSKNKLSARPPIGRLRPPTLRAPDSAPGNARGG